MPRHATDRRVSAGTKAAEAAAGAKEKAAEAVASSGAKEASDAVDVTVAPDGRGSHLLA